MNKLVFPALLVATIMVAGAFAFAPVEQASTVHTSGTVVSGTFTADTIDFEDIGDALTIDAATSIDTAAGTLTIDGVGGLKIDNTNGLVINKILTGSNTMAAGNLAEGADLTVVVTVTGADATNDIALCNIDTNPDFDELIITNTVITANTVTVTVTNPNLTSADTDVDVDGTDVVRCIVFGIA